MSKGDSTDGVTAEPTDGPDPAASERRSEGDGAPVRSVRVDGLTSLGDTPERIQRRRLASAAREVITRLVSTTAGPDELSDAADRLEAISELLGELPAGQGYEGFSEAANAGPALRAVMSLAAGARGGDTGTGDTGADDTGADDAASLASLPEAEWFAFFDHGPLIGLSNPLSPPLVLGYDSADPTRIRGEVNFGPAYEGPPGCVHGGYVAAVFDELLGAVQSMSGNQGMTAHLGVDYRSPTPLGEDLTMLGWVERTDGRKIWTRATLHSGEQLCAEADAMFVTLRPGGFRNLLESRR